MVVVRTVFMVHAVIVTRLGLVHLMNVEQFAKWLLTLRRSHPTWAVGLPVGCCRSHPPSPFQYYSAEKLINIHFTISYRVNLDAAVRMCIPCPRLCTSIAVVFSFCNKHTVWIQSWNLRHHSHSGMLLDDVSK